MLDPEVILHQVWQKDIPPEWHVYMRWRFRLWIAGCAVAVLVALVPLGLAFVLPRFWSNYLALAIGLEFGAIVIAAISLALALKEDTEPLKEGEVPPAVLVITPDGVVEFLSLQEDIRTIPFAYVSALRRYPAGKESDRAWLELEDRDGERSIWVPRVQFGQRGDTYHYEVLLKQIEQEFMNYDAHMEAVEESKENDEPAVL